MSRCRCQESGLHILQSSFRHGGGQLLLSTEYFWFAIIYSKFVYSSKVSPDTKLLHRLHMEKDEVYGTVIVSKLLRDYYRKYFWCMDLTTGTGTGIIHNPFRFMIRYLVLPGRTVPVV